MIILFVISHEKWAIVCTKNEQWSKNILSIIDSFTIYFSCYEQIINSMDFNGFETEIYHLWDQKSTTKFWIHFQKQEIGSNKKISATVLYINSFTVFSLSSAPDTFQMGTFAYQGYVWKLMKNTILRKSREKKQKLRIYSQAY